MESRKAIVIGEALLAVIVWGASFVATKIALRDVSPVTVVWLRFTFGLTILSIAVLSRRQLALPSRKELLYFALLGFLGITFHQWLQVTGLVTAQATTAAWILTTVPVFMAILGWLFLKEKIGRVQIAGIGLAIVGVVLVVSHGNLNSLFNGSFLTLGDVLVMLSAPNWAIFSILSRKGLKTYPATEMMFYVMGFGWLFTTLELFAGPGLSQIPALTISGWVGIGFLGIFCTGLAYIFWYDALQVLPATQAGIFLNIEPLVTVVVAAIFLGETFLPASLIGGAVILLGVWLVNRNGGKSVQKKQPVLPVGQVLEGKERPGFRTP